MRGWIPPLPLACGTLAFGASWIVLFTIVRAGSLAPSLALFGWLHLVTLGWITLIALAVLLHVIPAFLEVEWPSIGIARYATLAFAAGVAAMLFGFFRPSLPALQTGGTIVLAALLAYVASALRPLSEALRGERTSRAIARALGGTFVLLLATAALGTAMTYALAGTFHVRLLEGVPPAHALLGIGGWLTLLVLGVSARTLGPIAGLRSRWTALHIVAGSCVLLGTLAAAAGAYFGAPGILVSGAAVLLLGTLAYAVDVGDVLLRATNPHRPPQVLMGFAAAWALVSAALLLGAGFGEPWAPSAIYVGLIGWIGSAILAHLHHIGVRVLLTVTRGEDDETRPQAVLTAPLTWCTALLYQTAVVAGFAGILAVAPRIVELASVAGFLAFAAMLANLARAAQKSLVTLRGTT